METLIIDEVHELMKWIATNENKVVSVNDKFSLTVLNALWMIIAGQRYDQDDTKQASLLLEANE